MLTLFNPDQVVYCVGAGFLDDVEKAGRLIKGWQLFGVSVSTPSADEKQAQTQCFWPRTR